MIRNEEWYSGLSLYGACEFRSIQFFHSGNLVPHSFNLLLKKVGHRNRQKSLNLTSLRWETHLKNLTLFLKGRCLVFSIGLIKKTHHAKSVKIQKKKMDDRSMQNASHLTFFFFEFFTQLAQQPLEQAALQDACNRLIWIKRISFSFS